jgi:hypothetical protein
MQEGVWHANGAYRSNDSRETAPNAGEDGENANNNARDCGPKGNCVGNEHPAGDLLVDVQGVCDGLGRDVLSNCAV